MNLGTPENPINISCDSSAAELCRLIDEQFMAEIIDMKPKARLSRREWKETIRCVKEVEGCTMAQARKAVPR